MSCAPTSGPTTAKLAVLGEAPYPDETEPFTATPGAWFRQRLADAGISPAKLTFLYCVSSTPASPADEVFPELAYRAPSTEEVNVELPGRNALIDGINPRFVLLVGNAALQAYRPDLTVANAHGHPFCSQEHHPESLVYLPTFHPAGVMRDPRWMPALRDDLARLLAMGHDPENWDLQIPDTCAMCGWEGDVHCDPHLITYCPDHWSARESRS